MVLHAEDMTIGHRIDVLDQGAWRSLFERKSDIGYNWPPAEELPTIVPKPDEGWNTTLLVTEQQDVRPAPNPDTDEPIQPTALFRLDDAMYRWNGWSGAAPPVGSVLDSSTGQPKVVEPSVPADDQPVQVTVDYQVVPGSLPRLRFGRTYQMRARCVDLAGNSQPLSAIEGKDAVAAAGSVRPARTDRGTGRRPPLAATHAGRGRHPVRDRAAQRLRHRRFRRRPGRPAAVPRPGRPGPGRAARPARRWCRPGQLRRTGAAGCA